MIKRDDIRDIIFGSDLLSKSKKFKRLEVVIIIYRFFNGESIGDIAKINDTAENYISDIISRFIDLLPRSYFENFYRDILSLYDLDVWHSLPGEPNFKIFWFYAEDSRSRPNHNIIFSEDYQLFKITNK